MPIRLPNKKPQMTLNVWDIDDTLFTTEARVELMGPKGHIKTLEPGVYTDYVLNEGEYFDFTQFRSGKIFRESAKPVAHVLDRAKEMLSRKNELTESILLTARSDFPDHEEFLETFRDHGFPIDEVYVERAGNISGRYNTNAHISKAVIIRKYIAENKYNRIRMWDDSTKNLDMFMKLGRLHPEIEFVGYHVSEGKVTRYHPINETVKIPHAGMAISRSHMPQIPSNQTENFLKQLKKDGIKVTDKKVAASTLKPSQGEFNLERVAGFIQMKSVYKQHIITSNDGYVLDGHHRWLVQYNIDKKVKIDTYEVDLPILELIAYAKRFSGTTYRSVTDKIKKLVSESVKERAYK